MAFTEDLTPFFDLGGFATQDLLGGVSVSGLFDRPSQAAQVGAYGLSSSAPTYMLPTAQVPGNVIGAALVHAGVTYAVVAHEPDGTGVSTLILEVA